MKVKDLIEKLQELPEDMDIFCMSGYITVKPLDVYFEKQDIWTKSFGHKNVIIMKGEY